MKKDTKVFRVENGIDKSFESCDDCQYCDLPQEACRAMRCIHAFFMLKDCYKPKGDKDD